MVDHKYKFDTIGELLAACARPHRNQSNANNYFYRMDRSNEYWMCADRAVYNYTDVAKHLAEPLFQAGVDRIETMAAKLSAPTPTSRRRKARWSDQGDELDMQRVWQGDLDHCWRRIARETTLGPARVLIAISLRTSGGTSAETLAIRGTAALALATTLQAAGYCVGIVGGMENYLSDDRNTRYSAEVQLLAPGDAIDIHKLASLIASGLLFRGVFLDHELRVSERKLSDGVSHNAGAFTSESVDCTGYDYVAVGDEDNFWSLDSAQEWINEHLNALSPSDNQGEDE